MPANGGTVEYGLRRSTVVSAFRQGTVTAEEVCDAHPELLRMARYAGKPAGEACPICDGNELVHVTFAFGSRLPAGGRCVATQHDLSLLGSREGEVTCYVVEVCHSCSWNHLARRFSLGGQGIGHPARSLPAR